jgi:hypothetical protein
MSSSPISSVAPHTQKRTEFPKQDPGIRIKKHRTQANHLQHFPPLGAASPRSSVAALIRHVQAEQSESDTTKTEVYSETIADHDNEDLRSRPFTPVLPISHSPTGPQYGTGPIHSPIENISTPGGSSKFIFSNHSQAYITQDILGTGGDTAAYAAIFTSPGQTKYPAAAVHTTYTAKTIYSHTVEFGHLANIHVGNMDYVSLTLRGTTVENAAKKIDAYTLPQKYKLAFLLSYFPMMLEKLSLIEESGHAHEDVKPANLVIWSPTHAGPIDMRALPKIGDRKRTFSKEFTSPGKQLIRTAANSSDVFAIGRSISRGLKLFETSFSEMPGLPELLSDLEKPKTERPGLAEVKARLETCLQDFRAMNADEYEAQITQIQDLFFAQP